RFLAFLFLCAFAMPVFGQRAGPFSITANQCAQIRVSANSSSTVAISVGGTWSGTIQPEVIIAGQTAQNAQVTPSTSTTPQSTITASGIYFAPVAGVDIFEVCGNTITNTAVVYFNVSTGVASNLLGGGGGSGAGVTITNVAGLATVPGKTNGTIAVVTNGASATDCTVGGGSTLVTCQYNGSTWSQLVA